MLKIRKFIFLFLVCFSVSNSQAQKITQFANDTSKFVKDLSNYFFEFSVDKVQADDYMKNFDLLWKENFISGYFKEVAIRTANAMLKKRMKPHPYFYSYLNTLITSIETKKSPETFENWQDCVDKILKGKSMHGVQEFYEMSENIFKNNAFYKSSSYVYYSTLPNFKFDYDSIPKVVFTDVILAGINPRGDSLAIENTSGIYYPASGRFVGKGGKVSWERSGLDDGVYATIKRYTIDCKTGTYSTDSAIFVGKQFFDKPQIGRVIDKIVTENGEPTYPRFDSYRKRSCR